VQDLVIVKGDPGARMAGARPLFRETLVWVAAERAGFGEMVAACAARGRALPLVASPAPCVYRKRATAALDARHVAWTAAFTSQSFAGSVAAVRAGLGVSVMPRGMVPAGLAVLAHEDGWPDLADAEMCLLAQVRSSPAVAALVSFIEDRVARRG
jgi:DNA-binding transcriptional LysR family regulator